MLARYVLSARARAAAGESMGDRAAAGESKGDPDATVATVEARALLSSAGSCGVGAILLLFFGGVLNAAWETWTPLLELAVWEGSTPARLAICCSRSRTTCEVVCGAFIARLEIRR